MTFAPGDTSKTFPITIVDDAAHENNETVNLTLSAPNNATLGSPMAAILTIIDNDSVPTVQFSAAAYRVNEAGGSALITATLSAASDITVTVRYGSSNGTAIAGSDYTSVNGGTLTFSPGQTSKTFVVLVATDSQDESDETVHLALSNPNHASLGALSNALLTILDANTPLADPTVQFSTSTYQVDEQAGFALITVTLSAPSAKIVSVNYATSMGTATPDSDYATTTGTLTFDPGEISKTFSVPIIDDGVNEDAKTIELKLDTPVNATLGALVTSTLTIIDNDPLPTVQFSTGEYIYGTNNSGGEVMIEVRLSAASAKPITVNYAITHNAVNAAGVADTGTVTFNPGEISKMIAVPISADDLTGAGQKIIVTLSGAQNASLGMATATLVFEANTQHFLYLPLVVR